MSEGDKRSTLTLTWLCKNSVTREPCCIGYMFLTTTTTAELPILFFAKIFCWSALLCLQGENAGRSAVFGGLEPNHLPAVEFWTPRCGVGRPWTTRGTNTATTAVTSVLVFCKQIAKIELDRSLVGFRAFFMNSDVMQIEEKIEFRCKQLCWETAVIQPHCA